MNIVETMKSRFIWAANSAFHSRFFIIVFAFAQSIIKRAPFKSGCKVSPIEKFSFLKFNFCTIVLFSIISCGKISPKGNISLQQIDLEQFTKLKLDGNFRVFYVKSAKNFVTVETYENIGKNLDIEVEDKTLSITEKRPTELVDFYNITIYSKYNINEISMSKLAEMNLSSEIKTDHFKLFLKNNAKFIGSIQSRKSDVEMEELSRANFTGVSKNVNLKMKDTANLIAPYWKISNLKIETKNQPYAEVTVQDSITGNLEDTSKFLYYNDPIRAFKIGKNTKVNNKELE